MITTEQYIENLKKVRPDSGLVYDYSKSKYSGNDNKIIIICKIHGEFLQRAGDHRRGSGCPKCGRVKAAETNLKKYGTKNPASSEIVKNKIKTTFINKYGVDNPSKDPAVKQQKKDTCFKNYGVYHPSHSDAISNKKKSTNLKKYGVEFPTQNKSIIEKGVATKVANGGFNKSNSSKEATEFIREYIKKKGYLVSQCAYADIDMGLHEWGIYHNGRWILYDLVVFNDGHRGDKTQIVEILEYHGPFHYTKQESIDFGNQRAYPWKTNNTTILESYNRDVEKELLGRSMTNNYIVVRTRMQGDL